MTDAPSEKDIAQQIRELHKDVTFELQKRERPDRHPYQIGCLVGLLIVSIAQATLGLPPESALFGTADRLTIQAIDIAFVVGCAMCLHGAMLDRDKHFMLSLRLGIFGHLSIFVGCLAYTTIVIASTEPEFTSKPYWLSVTSVGLTLGVAYASIMRFRQMYSLLKESKSRERERLAE